MKYSKPLDRSVRYELIPTIRYFYIIFETIKLISLFYPYSFVFYNGMFAKHGNGIEVLIDETNVQNQNCFLPPNFFKHSDILNETIWS